MRIQSLFLKNFAPIASALDKFEVRLVFDPPNNKKINVIVGRMGTCKTFILGHLQPFATLGSLDVRNQDDLVIESKTGLKELVIQDGYDTYKIQHIYSPTKQGHSIKSYIVKNDKELNPNGNNASFKTIIQEEFGIDQSMLKLFRIGPNVVNLMDMTTTERKNFISSMMSETTIYNLLYKKIGEDLRMVNAQSVVLANKLKTISPNRSLEELESDLEESLGFVKTAQESINQNTARLYQANAAVDAILHGMTLEDYKDLIKEKESQKDAMQKEISDMEEKCKSISDYPDSTELNRIIGGLESRKRQLEQDLMRLSKEVEDAETLLNQLNDQRKIMGSVDHIDTLRATYEELCHTKDDYERQLQYFHYTGSRSSIENLIAELQTITQLITEMAQYKPEVIQRVLKNPEVALKYSKRQISTLEARKTKLQRSIGNRKYTEEYIPTEVLYRPFGCPTEKCPYYVHHPYTEKMRNIKHALDADSEFMKMRNEISKIDADLAVYEDFPYLASKLSVLKSNWRRVCPILKELGVLNESDLFEVITNLMKRNWYNSQKLQRIRELCGVREKYYELMEHIASMKNDIAKYELSDAQNLDKSIREQSEKVQKLTAKLDDMEKQLKSTEAELEKHNEIYLTLVNFETYVEVIHEREMDLSSVDSEISQMNENVGIVQSQRRLIDALTGDISRLQREYRTYMDDADRARSKINDLKITMDQYSDVLKDQDIMKDILDAVSSKKGIPLAFIKLFLRDSKNIINDLIYDVFLDSIEIQDFDIPEDGSEFNIPYTRNGNRIKDIEKASQGEKAIISLALSFALIRQSNFRYNIMLLDEVDGALYKSDRNTFIAILFKQLNAIQAEQVFLISHNNTFDGYDVNLILTTDEVVDENPLTTTMRV